MRSTSILRTISILIFVMASIYAVAQSKGNEDLPQKSFRTDCQPSISKSEMQINNVRVSLAAAGDLWWRQVQYGEYYVPKARGVSAFYAGSVWCAGYDPFDNLKLAANMYRSNSRTDFWSGPLSASGNIYSNECNNWDRNFHVRGDEVYFHIERYHKSIHEGIPYPVSEIPANILGWPAVGNPFFEGIHGFAISTDFTNLGSFVDADSDGMYNPSKGDYPVLRSNMAGPDRFMIPSEQSFNIFNDAGNTHTTSRGIPLQFQFSQTSFAFQTEDEVNDMTFTHFKISNHNQNVIDRGYFSYFIDSDLGCYQDDYFGTDSLRNMAYVYNQDDLDGFIACECNGVPTYCDNIPIVGVRFYDTPDDNRMSSTMHFFICNIIDPPPQMCSPAQPIEYYRFMQGLWRDGTPLTVGGSGFNTGSQAISKYAFHSPPSHFGSNTWSMCSESIGYSDITFLMNTTMNSILPGSHLEALSGVVYVPSQKYPCPDISYLQHASDKGELFLMNQLLDGALELKGPDAPDVTTIELDQEIIFILSNDAGSNNYRQEYRETEPLFRNNASDIKNDFLFEGYLVYQLRNADVSLNDLQNPDNARLVFQSDVKNGISDIYNWKKVPDPLHLYNLWAPELQVEGEDQGVRQSFSLTHDAFATGTDTRLVNNKAYHFVAVAYAHNNYRTFHPGTGLGQQFPYLEGEFNKKLITTIPRPVNGELSEIQYGSMLKITRLDGKGNPGIFLKLEDDMYDKVLSPNFDGEIRYKIGNGPVIAKVVDASKLTNASLQLTFYNEDGSNEVRSQSRWRLQNLATNEVIESERDISRFNEQIIETYGISLEILQADAVGVNKNGIIINNRNGIVDTRFANKDPEGEKWLSGISSGEFGAINPGNGQTFFPLKYVKTDNSEIDHHLDPNQAFSNTGEPSFIPLFIADYRVVNAPAFLISPMLINSLFGNSLRFQLKSENINNVDIVLTPDKSKWSRCVVIQTSNVFYTNKGFLNSDSTKMFDFRRHPSINKDGHYATVDGTKNGIPLKTESENPDDPNYVSQQGMGWFPGYAIDVETGQRLNVFFGENASYTEEFKSFYKKEAVIGDDMIWNPSDQLILDQGLSDPMSHFMGGQHFIYATRQAYDECRFIHTRLDPTKNESFKRPAFEVFTWCGFPILKEGQNLLSLENGLIPSETIIQLRANQVYTSTGAGVNNGMPQYLVHIDTDILLDTKLDVQSLSGIVVYPNPFLPSHNPTLFLKNIPEICQIRLLDLQGRTLFHQNLRGRIGERLQQLSLNLNGLCLQSGLYIIEINAGEEGRSIHKLLCF
jgi:hypothetical protein